MILILFCVCLCFVVDWIDCEMDIGQRDCCPLVWEKVVQTPSGYYIPKHAIEVGNNHHGHRNYYGLVMRGRRGSSPLPENTFGVVEESAPYRVVYRVKEGKLTLKYFDSHVGCIHEPDARYTECGLDLNLYVLSNPNICEIGWWKRRFQDQSPLLSSDILFPSMDGTLFSRYRVEKGEAGRNYSLPASGHRRETSSPDVGKRYSYVVQDILSTKAEIVKKLGEGTVYGLLPGPEFLFIDCATSASMVLKAELIHMKYESVRYEKSRDANKQTVLHSTSIINLSSVEQETSVKMMTTVANSVTIATDKGDKIIKKTDEFHGWKIEQDADIKTSIAEKVGVEASIKDEVSYMDVTTKKTTLETFAENGVATTNGKRTTYIFEQTVVEPPNSKTVVSIITTPVSGRISFSAGYRIKTPRTKNSNGISVETVRGLLKRLSMKDTIRNTTEEEGYLVYWKRGTLTFEMASHTHVKIASHSFIFDEKGKVIEEKDKKKQEYQVYPFGFTGTQRLSDSKYHCLPRDRLKVTQHGHSTTAKS